MVFKRRDKPPLLSRLREAVLPRRGWRRGIEYLGHRVRRLPDTPHRIALGFACGVFVSFTPFFGLHFVLAAGARLAAARQHRRGADRHRGRQPADLPADRPGRARARAAHPRLRRDRPRLRAGSPDAFAEAFAGDLGERAEPVRPRRERVAASSSRSSATSSGRTSSAGCCPGSSPRSSSYYLTRPLSPPIRRGGARGCSRGRTSGWRGRSPRLTRRARAYNPAEPARSGSEAATMTQRPDRPAAGSG